MNKQNQRGLEHVADGSFSGVIFGQSADFHRNTGQAETLINFSFRDNVPRPVCVTLVSPTVIDAFQGNSGFPSLLVEWGSGGFNSQFICDGREGDRFNLSCSYLRVSLFNDAIAQGFNPLYAPGGIVLPIDFGAFAALGFSNNKECVLKRTKTWFAPVAAGGSFVPSVPPYASRVRINRFPSNSLIIKQYNPWGDTLAAGLVTAFTLGANADCPLIELAGDTKALDVENVGAGNLIKAQAVWQLAL